MNCKIIVNCKTTVIAVNIFIVVAFNNFKNYTIIKGLTSDFNSFKVSLDSFTVNTYLR